ncbi:glycosyltransferase family 39 protein [bacterium]|nr:glycosyltransferase family 39 protein [bacterium]
MTWSIEPLRRGLNSRKAFPLLLGFGLSVRLLLLACTWRDPLFDDAAAYYTQALKITDSGTSLYLPPGLPAYLRLWMYLPVDGQVACRLSMLPVYLIFSLALFAYVRGRSGIQAANLAVLFFVFSPAFVFQSQFPLTQLPTATLCLMALLLLEKSVKPGGWTAAVTLGLVLGAAVLLRPSILILVPLLAALVWVRAGARRATKALLVAFAASVPLLAWEHHVWRRSGEAVFINSANSMNLFVGNNQYTPLYRTWWFGSHSRGSRDVPAEFSSLLEYGRSLGPADQERFFFSQALSHIASHPWLFAFRTFNRMRCFLAFDSFSGAQAMKHYRLPPWSVALVLGLDALCYCSIMLAALGYIVIFGNWMPALGWLWSLGCVALFYAAPYYTPRTISRLCRWPRFRHRCWCHAGYPVAGWRSNHRVKGGKRLEPYFAERFSSSSWNVSG